MVCEIEGLVLNFRAWERVQAIGLDAGAATGAGVWDVLRGSSKGFYIVGTGAMR